jgi:hypothetical protein
MATPARGPAKDKPFRDALRIAIADAGDDHKALRKIARALINNAMKGDNVAIKEVADRLDGKVAQPHGGDDELPAIQMNLTDGQRARALAALVAKTKADK